MDEVTIIITPKAVNEAAINLIGSRGLGSTSGLRKIFRNRLRAGGRTTTQEATINRNVINTFTSVAPQL